MWQTSNTEAGGGAGSSATIESNSVVPKPVERASVARGTAGGVSAREVIAVGIVRTAGADNGAASSSALSPNPAQRPCRCCAHAHRCSPAMSSANQFDKKSQAWSALFTEPMSELVKRYTASVDFDKRLWKADIAGSLAHAEMLAAQGILSPEDHGAIERGMAQIRDEIEAGTFDWKLDLEDVHLNIEARLTQLAGDAGKRLHTGRSRNDQVATDVRLWLRGEIDTIAMLLIELQRALVDVAEKNADVIMPGFTHLQVAQPVSFGHHLLAYVEMFARDAERLADVRRRTNRLPLGAAALAGTSYPLDRERVAKTLGMSSICHNSLDAVSDRDFAIEFCAAAACAWCTSRACRKSWCCG